MDVVPIEPGTEEKWEQDPFGGRIADGFICGRGAIDNKSTVLGALEAVEMLLGEAAVLPEPSISPTDMTRRLAEHVAHARSHVAETPGHSARNGPG